ncbi:CC0125/CC1285 family lipoprotein [Dyella kyungheensis]|uniref:CC0125/CC1285 family lipoprotein n=1 Tax=Dyella kyungheensis TaxID=1242174 RepID=UPI003CF51A7B
MKAWIARASATALVALALGGCATAYQSKGLTGGFSETVLSPDSFKINFSGNGFTSAERASDFAVLRAADKSLELGCNYFGIMNEADGATVGSATISSGGWNHHSAWGVSNTFPIVKPNSSLFVKCSREQVAGANLLDAHYIAQSIRAKYGIKTPVPGGGLTQLVAPSAPQVTASAAPVVSAPAPDLAALVRSAQQVATSQGCGDVHSTGGSSFQAKCTSFKLVIDCDGNSCHPSRAINN